MKQIDTWPADGDLWAAFSAPFPPSVGRVGGSSGPERNRINKTMWNIFRKQFLNICEQTKKIFPNLTV